MIRITAKELREAIEFLNAQSDEEIDYNEKHGFWSSNILRKTEEEFNCNVEKANMLLDLASIAEYVGGLNTPELNTWLSEHPEVYLSKGAKEIVCPEGVD